MSGILIAYTSAHGTTEHIAKHISREVERAGHDVELRELRRSRNAHEAIEPGRYDGIVCGASVHVGKHDRRMVDFVKTNLGVLTATPSAFFSVSLIAAGAAQEDRAEVARLVEQFAARTGWRPEHVAAFAGAVTYTRYNPIVRAVMKRIVRQYRDDTDTSRDYEYTDWDSVTTFTTDFLRALPA